MTLKPESAVILIPSLEPDDRLPAYMRRLLEAGFTRAVVVDDGSSEKYQPIFNELAEMPGVTVLHHEVNRGKGCALKTGYAYIRDNIPEASGVITADADGQHTVEEVISWWRSYRMESSLDHQFLCTIGRRKCSVSPPCGIA